MKKANEIKSLLSIFGYGIIKDFYTFLKIFDKYGIEHEDFYAYMDALHSAPIRPKEVRREKVKRVRFRNQEERKKYYENVKWGTRRP